MTTERYYVAACQLDLPNPATRDEIPARVDRMLTLMEYAVTGYEPLFDVRLVVFPEFAHAAPIYASVDRLLDRLAVPLPNEFTELYQRKCRQLNVYVQTGTFLESDARYPGHVFNTTCLIGPEGILTKYRKVHTWVPWELHTSPHDLPGYDEPLFPVAETPLGRLGVATCYDWLFPEAIRQLALGGAEVLIRVSAYMDPWGTMAPLDWWTAVNRVRAIENMAYVVACNQASSLAHYPPFSWPGGSQVVDYDGRVLAQANPGPGRTDRGRSDRFGRFALPAPAAARPSSVGPPTNGSLHGLSPLDLPARYGPTAIARIERSCDPPWHGGVARR